jgi:hypothetical protein
MASDGRRVFVLGGELSSGARVDEATLIHVLDTSVYFLFVISFGLPSYLKQSSSFTLNPTPILSSVVRRPRNLRRSYPRVTRAFTSENMGRPTSPQTTHERNPGLNGLPSQLTVQFKSNCLSSTTDQATNCDTSLCVGSYPCPRSVRSGLQCEVGSLVLFFSWAVQPGSSDKTFFNLSPSFNMVVQQ